MDGPLTDKQVAFTGRLASMTQDEAKTFTEAHGEPGVPWHDIEDEARFWASWASLAERRAYIVAIYGTLNPEQRRHFLAWGGRHERAQR